MSGFGGWNSGLRTASQNAGAGAVATNTADASKLSGQLDSLRGIYNPNLISSNVVNSSNAANNLALTGGYNPVTPSTPDLGGRGRETYQNFSDTGGYTPDQSAAFIRNAVRPTEAVYNQAGDQLYRQRALQGGYMPGFDASSSNITRGAAEAGANAQLGAQTNLQQIINQNKLAGASGLAGTRAAAGTEALGQTELGIQQASNTQKGLIAGEQALQNFNQFGANGITQADMLDLQNRAQTGNLTMADAQLLEGLAHESPALLQSIISAIPGILSALTSMGKPTINITNSGGSSTSTATGGAGGAGGGGGSTGPITNTNTATATANASGGGGGGTTTIPPQPPQPPARPPIILPPGPPAPPVPPPGNPPPKEGTGVTFTPPVPGQGGTEVPGAGPIDPNNPPIPLPGPIDVTHPPSGQGPGYEDPNLPGGPYNDPNNPIPPYPTDPYIPPVIPPYIPPPADFPGAITPPDIPGPGEPPFIPPTDVLHNPPTILDPGLPPAYDPYDPWNNPNPWDNGGGGNYDQPKDPNEYFSYMNSSPYMQTSAAVPSLAYSIPAAMQQSPVTMQSPTAMGPSDIEKFLQSMYGSYGGY